MKQFVVRTERPADFDVIDDVVAAAFESEEHATLVRLLRESDYYVPDLAMVADEVGEVIGHIMLTFADLEGGSRERILSLSPLAVRPDRQRDGVGIALTRRVLEAADDRGEPLVIVLGHPAYYPRFGFESARKHGIEPPDPAFPDEAFMVVRLRAYDPSVRGRVSYPPAFDVVP
jgi:putative acetyltransferase